MDDTPLSDQFPVINGEVMGTDKLLFGEKHLVVKKPWGSYTDYLRRDSVVFKTIRVNPNQRLSLQSHKHRSEMWSVIEGECTCVLDGVTTTLKVGENILIPKGAKHRMANYGEKDCVVAEMQFGICWEDDIIRYEDDYSRK